MRPTSGITASGSTALLVLSALFASQICLDEICGAAAAAAAEAASAVVGGHDESVDYVTRECSKKLANLNTIGKFNEFIKHYKIVLAEGGNKQQKRHKGISSFLSLDSMNSERSLEQCILLERPLLALAELVSERTRVCHMDYINKLVEFHITHLTNQVAPTEQEEGGGDSSSSSSGINVAADLSATNASWVKHFFSLYAHQVAQRCKRRLSGRVHAAQEQQDCSQVISMFIQSPPPEAAAHDNAQTREGGLLKFLDEFQRVEDFAPMLKLATGGGGGTQEGAYFNVPVGEQIFAKISLLKEKCRAREPYYSALFGPVATLALLGYEVDTASGTSSQQQNKGDNHDDEAVNSEGPDGKLLKCWLATAQLCQGLLKTHFTSIKDSILQEGDEHGDRSPIEVDFGQAPGDAQDGGEFITRANLPPGLSMDETINEISPQIVELVKKKRSTISRLRRKALKWSKRYLKIGSSKCGTVHNFLEALVRDDNSPDSAVSFNGHKPKSKRYNFFKLVTDDTDSFFTISTFFLERKLAVIMSAIVGIVLSAAFVWFSIYALATHVRPHRVDPNNFKSSWRKLRDERLEEMASKIKGENSFKDHVKVYKPM